MSEYFRRIANNQNASSTPPTIRFWTSFTNCILKSLKNREWKESEYDNDWDIAWVEKETVHDLFDRTHLTPTQKVNHFRNHYELTRKDLMIKNLKRFRRGLDKEGKSEEAALYNFFPATYNLPLEYNMFCDEFKKSGHAIWIMKPVGKSQGKGIFLFKKLSQISEWKIDAKSKDEGSQVENYIVQRYIHNPLLIGGKKFDLRIYCLVTSYMPLVAYLYRDGFARFTHHRYSNSDITNTYVHLTNVAIQKHSENYDKKIGGKWDLRTLKLYLLSKYGPEKVGKCFMDIQQLIIRTLLSVQKVIVQDKHCFELYGFDILIDSHLKPWVLEVNGSPSMTANTAQDCELKCGLLDDVFSIIDMEKMLTGQEEQVGGFDLIYKGAPIQSEANLNSSMLGCENNRLQQLKKLAKLITQKAVPAPRTPKEHLVTEPKRSRDTRDIPQPTPMPIASIPIDITTTVSAKKFRSKSTGKPAVNAASLNVSSSSRVPRNLFNQKAMLLPLSQEGREPKESRESRNSRDSRERRDSSQQNRLKIYKGRIIDLPPMNNGISSNSNVATTLSNINPSSQKVSTTTADIISNNSHLVSSNVSTASHTNSSEVHLKPSHRAAQQQYNLANSMPSYPGKGYYNSPDTGSKLYTQQQVGSRGESPSVLLTETLPAKEKTEKNFLYANWQAQDAIIHYNLSNPSSVEKRLREGFSRQLKTLPPLENKSGLKFDDDEPIVKTRLSTQGKDTINHVHSEVNNE